MSQRDNEKNERREGTYCCFPSLLTTFPRCYHTLSRAVHAGSCRVQINALWYLLPGQNNLVSKRRQVSRR